MNKFKFYFTVITASVLFFSCSKDDNNGIDVEPPKDYTEQYEVEKVIIEDYLKENYIVVVDKPGFPEDQDITISRIDAGQPSILSYLNATAYPKLLSRDASMNGVTYKLYYLVLRPGVGISPCNVDGVLASYKGTYLNRSATTATPPSELTATFFEELKDPQTPFSLNSVIRGWGEIFPKFKTGETPTINPNGTVTYKDFGAGVMFIPSGLAYYNLGSGGIPAYAPLVFSFKLYNIVRLDQDNDGVFSYQEDLNNDGYVYDFRNTTNYPTPPTTNPDDTDGDKIPDFLDVDDDGDNYTTRLEITKPVGINSGLSLYFPFDPIVDNPFTTVDETETKGIPRKFTGPLLNPSLPETSTNLPTPQASDYTDPSRLRRHLDANCKPPYQN